MQQIAAIIGHSHSEVIAEFFKPKIVPSDPARWLDFNDAITHFDEDGNWIIN